MTAPLISICVPVYNVAPYIERCVRSIMEQTYENLEYIFVDDGSTDDSISILKKVMQDYPEHNGRVTVITNGSNRGTAYSRRVYTKKAQGDYIICVDSDDYIEKDMVQCLIEKAQETNADIVASGFFYESSSIKTIAPPLCDEETDYIFLVLSDSLNSMCSKLFRRTLFTKGYECYAPDGLDYMEDRLMMLFVSVKVNRIVTINKPLYHYMRRSDSITTIKNDRHFLCLLRFWQEADSLLETFKLTDKYLNITDRGKLTDKVHLLHFCKDISLCRKYADIFPEAEAHHPKLQLTRGKQLTRFLTKQHFWFLLWLYKHFYMR